MDVEQDACDGGCCCGRGPNWKALVLIIAALVLTVAFSYVYSG